MTLRLNFIVEAVVFRWNERKGFKYYMTLRKCNCKPLDRPAKWELPTVQLCEDNGCHDGQQIIPSRILRPGVFVSPDWGSHGDVAPTLERLVLLLNLNGPAALAAFVLSQG
jgi:hypothetical protein